MDNKPSRRDALLSVAKSNAENSAQERGMAGSPEASQIRAARALLNWSVTELSIASGLTAAMVGRVEDGTVRPSKKTMDALRGAFSTAGAILIPAGATADEGLGVRLRKDEP